MRNKNEKARGAEVRVSRAKSRVTARKKVAAKSSKPQYGKRTPEQPHELEARVGVRTRVPAVSPTTDKTRDEPHGELERERKEKKSRRERGRRTDSRKAFPAAVEARGESKRDGRKWRRSGMKEARQPHTEAAAMGAEKAPHAKKKRGANRSVRILALGTLLVASLAALLWVYTATGVLNVNSVEVRGNEVLGEDYLRSLSGITGDTHLLKMDVKAVESALLSEPYVASVDVSRRYPNTVVLEIIERKPTGYILQNGNYHLVDQEGTILESVEARPSHLVEIKDLDLQLLLPGMELSGRDFATVTSLLGSLPEALKEITTAVGLDSSSGLYLEGQGTLVIYGEASDLALKNTIALMALTGLVDRYEAVEYIDISFPEHPVIKPAGTV